MEPDETLVEGVGDRYAVITPPNATLTTEEPGSFVRSAVRAGAHPATGVVATFRPGEMIKHSVNIHRGCFGGCSFCTISAHQGKFITSRSEKKSILREVERVTRMPDFRGYLSDIGAPSANMYRMGGRDREHAANAAVRRVCIRRCAPTSITTIVRCSISMPKCGRSRVKKAFIGSGIRYDLFDGSDYLDTVIRHHTSGRLKVAPEHTEDAVLKLMRKPPFVMFERLNADFNRICRREGLPYQADSYFISSHPGCTERDMRSLADKVLGKLHFDLEQVQDLTLHR